MIAEVRGNNPNFKQKLAEKQKFVISRVSESQPLLSKCRFRAARFKKLTTRGSVEKYESGNKKSNQKAVISVNFISKNSTKRIYRQPRGHMNTQKMLRGIRRQTLEAIFWVTRVLVISQRAKTIEALHLEASWPDNLSTTERTLTISWRLLQAFQLSSWSPVHFYCLCNQIKSFWKSRKRLSKDFSSSKKAWQKFARSRNLHQN